MKNWGNQIYIGLMTGLTAGLVSAYLFALLLKVGFGLTLIRDTIILVVSLAILNIGFYYLVFERKLNKPKRVKELMKKIIRNDNPELFGNLFEIVGGILISFGIIRFIESIEIPIIKNYFILLGLGYLFFVVGFYAKTRDKKEFYPALINLTILFFLMVILMLII